MLDNATGLIAATMASTAVYDDVYTNQNEAESGSYSFYLNDAFYLRLRFYAKHIIPVFCVVGILGNCMVSMFV
jgi:hypothetical protein